MKKSWTLTMNVAMATLGVVCILIFLYYVCSGRDRYSRFVKYNCELLERHASSISDANGAGSPLQYEPATEGLDEIGIRGYWCSDGYIFYLLPRTSGIDDPDEALVFDAKYRANSPRAIVNMYPRFILYGIGKTGRPAWYYFVFRK